MTEKVDKPVKAVTKKKSGTVKEPAALKAPAVTSDGAELVKPKAAAKPRKVAVPKKTLATVTAIDGHRESGPATVSLMGFSAEEVARLAHQYWLERGCQHGNDAEDWFRAEQALRSKAS